MEGAHSKQERQRTHAFAAFLVNNLQARTVADDRSGLKALSAACEFYQVMLLLPRHLHNVFSAHVLFLD